MNLSSSGRLHLIFSFFAALTLSACDGGKSRTDCSVTPSAASCSNQCPADKELVNGVCQTRKPTCNIDDTDCQEPISCGIGQKLEADACVDICPALQHFEAGQCVDNDISIEIISTSACSESDSAYTQVSIQFIARDNDGFAIDPRLDSEPTTLTSTILIDGRPANNESTTEHESQLLKSNMMLSLVLDNSDSMTEQSNSMKSAAISILNRTKLALESNSSTFNWEVLWFNDNLFKPTLNAAGEPWTIASINQIPAPTGGTGLYKAVHHMVGIHQARYEQGVAAQERDQHIMIVLSDGKDTLSHYDGFDPTPSLPIQNADDTLRWTKFDWYSVGLDDTDGYISLIEAIIKMPKLQIHVVGLGTQANSSGELQTIATTGKGLYFDSEEGSSSISIDQLFKKVQKEFITIQTISLRTSPPNGVYDFSIHSKNNATFAEGRSNESFPVTVGSLEPCAP